MMDKSLKKNCIFPLFHCCSGGVNQSFKFTLDDPMPFIIKVMNIKPGNKFQFVQLGKKTLLEVMTLDKSYLLSKIPLSHLVPKLNKSCLLALVTQHNICIKIGHDKNYFKISILIM